MRGRALHFITGPDRCACDKRPELGAAVLTHREVWALPRLGALPAAVCTKCMPVIEDAWLSREGIETRNDIIFDTLAVLAADATSLSQKIMRLSLFLEESKKELTRLRKRRKSARASA